MTKTSFVLDSNFFSHIDIVVVSGWSNSPTKIEQDLLVPGQCEDNVLFTPIGIASDVLKPEASAPPPFHSKAWKLNGFFLSVLLEKTITLAHLTVLGWLRCASMMTTMVRLDPPKIPFKCFLKISSLLLGEHLIVEVVDDLHAESM